jgi:hypothetical protein
MVRLHLVTCVALAAGGCGLISSDVTDFDLSLPDKTYTVDSDSFGITADPDVVLNMACATGSGTCEVAAEQVCPDGQCRGECNATSLTCDLIIPIHPFTTVDLASEKSELAAIDDQTLIDVTVDSISYRVGENTLDTTTPPLTLYVAPASVTSPDDSGAVSIGTIPMVQPAMTLPETDLVMSSEGHDRLVQAMANFRTPFNVLVAADIVLTSGDSIPTGRMTTTLTIRAHAGL